MIPAVDKKFEKFDVEDFYNNIKNDFYVKKLNNKIIIAFLHNSEYIITEYDSEFFFKIDKAFHSNGYLKLKYLSFNNGSPIGKIYFFDESGKLIKEEDTDIGYDFGPMEVLRYCKKNGISLPKGYQEYGFHTRVLKLEREGKKVWKIFYPIKSDLMKEIVLDGKTGKELEIKFKPIKNS
ncbi:hypothetical protein [Bergeyella zoohelcum]|uniref:MORN repeat variant n=1 Tax=Bergeyella zoohelcum TaxID=1015 RepID=A0A380ZVD3_9FLAO|nr:hypothetical protein [Bergeyella zoohelcum]EKB59901.1 hypothetical protein HMPREF9700_01407 [Bergeyella zoohelcum CCUG 30536]SUV52726.1 Uncharacterised protein [Bergeyella zoohelcum]